MRVDPGLKDIVAFLYREQNGQFIPIGTGFRIVIIEGDLVFNHLVTCKHVVNPVLDDGDPIYARLLRSDKPDVAYRPLASQWEFHADQAVDLAVLPCPPTGEPFSIAAVSTERLLTDEKLRAISDGIGEGDDVFFIGLFEPYAGYHRNIPVVRSGRVAMVTDEPTLGVYGPAHHYLLEIQAYPFNSGSPLFIPMLEGERLAHYVMGVVAGFFPERQRVSMGDMGLVQWTHLGISTAVPAARVHDILYNDQLVEARKNKVWAGRLKKRPNQLQGIE